MMAFREGQPIRSQEIIAAGNATERDIFSVVISGLEENPLAKEFREVMGLLGKTPIHRNESLLTKAVDCVDKAKGLVPDEQRLGAYLGLFYRYVEIASPATNLIIERALNTLDETSIAVNQKMVGISKVFGLTPVCNKSLLDNLMARMNQYLDQTTDTEILTKMLNLLSFADGDSSVHLQTRVRQRVQQLSEVSRLMPGTPEGY